LAADPSQRARRILAVIVATFVANLAVALGKIVIGMFTGLLSLTASGFESLLDSANNIFGYVAIRLSARAPDAEHPYGHRKFETFAAMLVAILIFLAGSQIFVTAVRRLQGTYAPQVNAWAYGAIIASLLVSTLVTICEYRFGKAYRSEFLRADAGHTLCDALSGLLVLAAIVLAGRGWVWADLAAAIVVVIIILVTGYRLMRQSFDVLTDTARLNPNAVASACLRVEGIEGVHKVRSRGTSDSVKVDLHIQVDRKMNIEQAHLLAHQAKHEIRKDFPAVDDVVVHIEPCESGEAAVRTESPPPEQK